MAARSKHSGEDFATVLARYQARPARYTGEVEARRRDDWDQAVGICELDGLPAPDDAAGHLPNFGSRAASPSGSIWRWSSSLRGSEVCRVSGCIEGKGRIHELRRSGQSLF